MTPDAGAPRSEVASRRAFVLRRLHSLSGVLPLGVFVVAHLWTNASALGGRAPFNRAVDELQSLPALPAIEVVGVLLPLAFHAAFGVYLSTRGRPNVARYNHGRNWAYLFQRVSGVVALVFVVAHLWELRVQKWLFGLSHSAFYDTLALHLGGTRLGLPLVALFYLLGVGAVAFHLANGLVTFCMTWGLVVSRAAQKRLELVFAVGGSALFLLGAGTVLSLATGSHLGAEDPAGLSAPCP